MKPILINWISVNDSVAAVALNAPYTYNVPAPFVNPSYVSNPNVSVSGNIPGNLVPPYGDGPRYSLIPNLGKGAQTPIYEMPFGTVRNINISPSSGSINELEFGISGLNQYGRPVNEIITGTGSTVFGVNLYSKILAITPISSTAEIEPITYTVGLGYKGHTFLSEMDQWNKNNNYTIAYSNVEGIITLTPTFTVNPVMTFVGGVQTYIETPGENSEIYYALPTTNPNIISSPASASTLPVTNNCAFSTVGIPLTGLLTIVNATSTGSFTQTILQQGGLV